MRAPLPWRGRDSAIMWLLAIFAAGIRFVRLSVPPSLVFDETYYAKDACLYLGNSQTFCGLNQATEQSYVHPPLGKWLIAFGIKVFGYDSFGWRVAAAVAGTILVLLVFLFVRKVFRDRWAAGAAGFLVAADFLMIVQSRVAMLDIFLVMFIMLGFLFLAYDYERVLAWREYLHLPGGREPPPREYEWRFAAGAAFGMAASVKWSAAWAMAAAGLLMLAWTIGLKRLERHVPAESQATAPGLFKELAVMAGALVLVPAVVYLSSYSLYFADTLDQPCPYRTPGSTGDSGCASGVKGTALAFADLHRRVYDYHMTLRVSHPYESKAYTWPLVTRPIAYYYQSNQESVHILAFGNPITWYAALAAGIWLLYRSSRPWRPERIIVLGWVSQYLPWLAVARPLFFFYMAPAVPFMMSGLAVGLSALKESARPVKWLVYVFLIAVIVALIWFYPVIAAVGLPYQQWHKRMWYEGWI